MDGLDHIVFPLGQLFIRGLVVHGWFIVVLIPPLVPHLCLTHTPFVSVIVPFLPTCICLSCHLCHHACLPALIHAFAHFACLPTFVQFLPPAYHYYPILPCHMP